MTAIALLVTIKIAAIALVASLYMLTSANAKRFPQISAPTRSSATLTHGFLKTGTSRLLLTNSLACEAPRRW
jgi:hypothetical protein